MSKKYKLVVALVSCCVLTSCGITDSVDKGSLNSKIQERNSSPIEKEKNYKLYYTRKDGEDEYLVKVFNSHKKIMYVGTFAKRPDMFDLGKEVLRLHWGAGNVSQYIFFDVQRTFVSPIYYNPELVENNKIVYMDYRDDKIVLIVSDLFDKSNFYKEFERDFSPVAAPNNALISAKFLGSNSLEITYLSGIDYKELKETIGLDGN